MLAVSGGLDSIAMLHILHGLKAGLKVSLQVATFNHGWRAAAVADIDLVREAANQLGLPVHVGIAKPIPTTEAAARQARYTFLARVAHQIGANAVVTAHHADDQVETILLHLLRGSGLDGLQGMALVSPLPFASEHNIPDLRLVRPLLYTPQAELYAYAMAHNLHWHEDSSNANIDYTRNYIRHEVLPILKTVNPSVGDTLLRLAESARIERDYLEMHMQPKIENAIQVVGARVMISRNVFGRWHPALRRRALRYVLAQHFPYSDAGHVHFIHAERVGVQGEVGTLAQFPAGVQLRVDYEVLVIEHAGAVTTYAGLLLPVDFGALQLPLVPGVVAIPGANWRIAVSYEAPAPPYVRLILPDREASLTLRGRQPGDRILPAGMGGHSRKLKDWLIDRKVPQAVRDRLPLLVHEERILAVISGFEWFLMYENDTNNSLFIIFVKFYF